jgi:hypothetical protein
VVHHHVLAAIAARPVRAARVGARADEGALHADEARVRDVLQQPAVLGQPALLVGLAGEWEHLDRDPAAAALRERDGGQPHVALAAAAEELVESVRVRGPMRPHPQLAGHLSPLTAALSVTGLPRSATNYR